MHWPFTMANPHSLFPKEHFLTHFYILHRARFILHQLCWFCIFCVDWALNAVSCLISSVFAQLCILFLFHIPLHSLIFFSSLSCFSKIFIHFLFLFLLFFSSFFNTFHFIFFCYLIVIEIYNAYSLLILFFF